mmetsp:Transcript_59297/g.168603  ORF Transcript_59297/g.168603 Transcript_59297/m.168603 type:complete len:336 (-) Transcript_59297:531-1538(-)
MREVDPERGLAQPLPGHNLAVPLRLRVCGGEQSFGRVSAGSGDEEEHGGDALAGSKVTVLRQDLGLRDGALADAVQERGVPVAQDVHELVTPQDRRKDLCSQLCLQSRGQERQHFHVLLQDSGLLPLPREEVDHPVPELKRNIVLVGILLQDNLLDLLLSRPCAEPSDGRRDTAHEGREYNEAKEEKAEDKGLLRHVHRVVRALRARKLREGPVVRDQVAEKLTCLRVLRLELADPASGEGWLVHRELAYGVPRAGDDVAQDSHAHEPPKDRHARSELLCHNVVHKPLRQGPELHEPDHAQEPDHAREAERLARPQRPCHSVAKLLERDEEPVHK